VLLLQAPSVLHRECPSPIGIEQSIAVIVSSPRREGMVLIAMWIIGLRSRLRL